MKTETIQAILIFLVTIILLVAVAILIIHNMSPQIFKEAFCPENNGTYWELQNVTCAVQYPNCRMMCALPNGTDISYYDDWATVMNITNSEGAV